MAKTFRPSAGSRFGNRVVGRLVAIGVPVRGTYLMTVPGRVSGTPRTVPLVVHQQHDTRWLVAPYGVVDWVKNVRAAGQVQLRRGRRVQTLSATEVPPGEAAPVLKDYLGRVKVVRPYVDTPYDAPVEAFEAEAARRPVFRLDPPA